MRHAIQYALTYPERKENCMEPLDFKKLSQLTFEEPDLERFPCLNLAYKALKIGGTMPATLNAANEIAVQAFLDGKIKLSEIARINVAVMDSHIPSLAADLEAILEADRSSRRAAEKHLNVSANTAAISN